MDTEQKEKAPPEIERLLLDLARVCHWTGLYQPGHPFLADRVKAVHAALSDQVAREPSNRLLLGIARDKVLYRDVFLGQGHHQIASLAEMLYLHQVATLGFDPEVTPEGLLGFFRCLQNSRPGKTEESLEDFLKREGIRGIHLYPYNYKEVLSRRIADSEDRRETSDGRTESLWKMLLTANVGDKDGEMRVAEGLTETPELIPLILRRAHEAVQKKEGSSNPLAPGEAVTPEVLRRMFHRLGETLRRLPPDKKENILLQLDSGLEGYGGEEGGIQPLGVSLARSMASEYSEDEFLDMLGILMSVEKKGGKRLQKVFEVIATEHDIQGSLLPRLNERVRESRRLKDYFAVKTWETVEKLLLSRSEEAYVGGDHARFLETLTSETLAKVAKPLKKTASAPEILASFEEEPRRQKAVTVLLELLVREKTETEFFDQLEEVQKTIPNLLSRREFFLLEMTLNALSNVGDTVTGECQSKARQVIGEVDYAQLIDHCIARDISEEDKERVTSLIVKLGTLSVVPLLDRLLVERETARRRMLLALAVRLGESAAPAILERMSHPRWYYVRNLCYILGEMGYKGAVPGLIHTLQNAEPRVKREAILALGKIKAPQATSTLGKILLTESFFASSKDDSTRIDAANALFRIGGAEAMDFLQRGKKMRRAPVREHCATLMRRLEAG